MNETDVDDYFLCPCCGAELKASATYCRECGASEDSGWNDEAYEAEDDFDYDEYVAREFPDAAPSKPNWKQTVIAVVALLLCLAFVLQAIL